VPEQTDPDAIQREIERTRAELAETIDAIADRVSPKRAFARTTEKVRGAIKGDTRPRLRVGMPELGQRRPFTVNNSPSETPNTAADRHTANARPTGAPGGATASLYTVERRLRVDRVLMVVGGVIAVTVAVVLVRRRGD
jgi:Protein of unknown function (DUF3618)